MARRRHEVLLLFLLLLSVSGGSARVAEQKMQSSACNVVHPSDARLAWDCRTLKKGETLEGLCGERWKDVARFNRVDRRHLYPGRSLKVPRQIDEIVDYTPLPAVYPSAEEEAKFILVDLSEQFLGAYQFGRLVFSSPVTTGREGNETPAGEFRITARDSRHRSTLYFIEGTDIPYPMTYALRFATTSAGISVWIHGRDVPGYPASHSCIGLYDEVMQKKYYATPSNPVLEDARTLFEWVIAPLQDDGKFVMLKEGPRLLIVGRSPYGK